MFYSKISLIKYTFYLRLLRVDKRRRNISLQDNGTRHQHHFGKDNPPSLQRRSQGYSHQEGDKLIPPVVFSYKVISSGKLPNCFQTSEVCPTHEPNHLRSKGNITNIRKRMECNFVLFISIHLKFAKNYICCATDGS